MGDHIYKSICQGSNIAIDDNIVIASRDLPFRMFLFKTNDLDYFAHTCVEVIYVVSGTIRASILGVEKILNEGDVFLVGSNIAHKIEYISDNVLLSLQIGLDYLKENSTINEDTIFEHGLLKQDRKKKLVYDMGLLYLELLYEETSYDRIFEELGQLIGNLEALKSSKKRASRPRDTMENIIADILEGFGRNPGKTPVLSDLAKDYGVSNYYLSRKFREISGRNFTDYYRIHRVNIAIDYLINTDKMITEIVDLSGFPDIKGLNRDFNRIFNLSASQFRKNYKKIQREANLDLLEKDNNLVDFLCYVESLNQIKKDSDSYEFDINKKDVKTYANWNEIVSLESIIWKDVDYLRKVLDLINIKEICIKFVFDGYRYYYSGPNGRLIQVDPLELYKLIDILNDYKINCILKLDLLSHNESVEIVGSEMEILYIFDKYMEIIGDLKIALGNNLTLNNSLEIYLPRIGYYMEKNLEELIFKEIEDLRYYIDGNLEQNLRLGFYIGDLEVLNIEENRSYLSQFQAIGDWIDFFTLDFTYYEKSTYEALEYEKILASLEYIKEETFGGFLQEGNKIIAQLSYIMGEESYKIKDYKMPYFNLLFLSFFFKMIEENFKISNFVLEYRLEDGESYMDYGNFYNEVGIEKVNYYISKFYNDLGNKFYYIENGYIATRDEGKINIILYGDYLKYLQHLRTSNFINSDYPRKNTCLKIKGLRGSYRIRKYKIGCNTMFFYYNWIEGIGVENLTEEDIIYIRAKSMPDMEVDYVDVDGDLELNISLEVLDIYSIDIEKLD